MSEQLSLSKMTDEGRDRERELAHNRKRRGVARASITRLENRVGDLEAKPELDVGERAMALQLTRRLSDLDAEFKRHHFTIIDLVDETAIDGEQSALDDHDDRIIILTSRLQRLTEDERSRPFPMPRPLTIDPGSPVLVSRRLDRVEKNLRSLSTALESLTGEDIDVCIVRGHEEQLTGLKYELANVSQAILAMPTTSDDLVTRESALDKTAFDVGVKLRRLLQSPERPASRPAKGDGVKLPKLGVPVFDGSIMNWRCFWDQFVISVHERGKLTDPEKLAYLKHALKDGSAKHVVEGLSSSGEQYKEAIECLKKRYNRPRLLHQAHVQAILEAPVSKEGTGRELRHLHDVVNQHVRALKAMGCTILDFYAGVEVGHDHEVRVATAHTRAR